MKLLIIKKHFLNFQQSTLWKENFIPVSFYVRGSSLRRLRDSARTRDMPHPVSIPQLCTDTPGKFLAERWQKRGGWGI